MEFYHVVTARRLEHDFDAPDTSSPTVCGVIGPSRTQVIPNGSAESICLVDAILTRAFELQLSLKAKTRKFPPDPRNPLSKSFDPPLIYCECTPCPIVDMTQSASLRALYFSETGRIPVEASGLTTSQVESLRWGLADIQNPLTPLGRAHDWVRYAICSSRTVFDQPVIKAHEIWDNLMSLLVQLGVDDIAARVTAAGLLVWDFVKCSAHVGLGAGMVLEPFTTDCACQVCCRRFVIAPDEEFENDIYRWWKSEENLCTERNEGSLTQAETRQTGALAALPKYERLRETVALALFKFEEVRRHVRDELLKWRYEADSSIQIPKNLLRYAFYLGGKRAWQDLPIDSLQCGKKDDSLNLCNFFGFFWKSENPLPLRFTMFTQSYAGTATQVNVTPELRRTYTAFPEAEYSLTSVDSLRLALLVKSNYKDIQPLFNVLNMGATKEELNAAATVTPVVEKKRAFRVNS